MTVITIVYHNDNGDESEERAFDNPADAVRWTVANLAGVWTRTCPCGWTAFRSGLASDRGA